MRAEWRERITQEIKLVSTYAAGGDPLSIITDAAERDDGERVGVKG